MNKYNYNFILGTDSEKERMEICELQDNPKNHPYYVAVQFHPEYLSRPLKPAPAFMGLILAAVGGEEKLKKYFKHGNRLSPRIQSDDSSDDDSISPQLANLKLTQNGHGHYSINTNDNLDHSNCNGFSTKMFNGGEGSSSTDETDK